MRLWVGHFEEARELIRSTNTREGGKNEADGLGMRLSSVRIALLTTIE